MALSRLQKLVARQRVRLQLRHPQGHPRIMTTEPTPLVTVLPCDRTLFNYLLGWDVTDDTPRIATGAYDEHPKLQAIARHRLAALEEAAKVAEAMYVKDAFRFEFGNDIATAIRALSNKTGDGGQESAVTESEAIAIAPERARCIDIFCHSCGWCVKNRRCAREVLAIMKGESATGNAGDAQTAAAHPTPGDSPCK